MGMRRGGSDRDGKGGAAETTAHGAGCIVKWSKRSPS